MSDDWRKHFSKIDREEATRILSQWRMEGLHVYSNRINFLLFTQSIFYMAFATLIIGGNIESKMILYVSVIMCISGIFTAFIFGYTTKIYYDREFGLFDNKMEEIWDWFRIESKAGHIEHRWYVNRILTIVLPAFFIVVWVFLLLLLFELHKQPLEFQVLVTSLLSLIILYFVLDAYRWKGK
jgi:uncharacterized ion transporter superfamily protein YfcC